MRQDGSEYVGGWRNGKCHGKGELKTSDTLYSGDFEDGRFNGKGRSVGAWLPWAWLPQGREREIESRKLKVES